MLIWLGDRLCLILAVAAGAGAPSMSFFCSSPVVFGFAKNSFLNRVCVFQSLTYNPLSLYWNSVDVMECVGKGNVL